MPRSRHSGRSSGSAVLVEQRVASRDEEDVHLRLPGEPGEHRRLVHARPDRAEDALLAQPVQGRIGALDGGLPVVVGIVDERHVDPVEPEPLEALLDRAHDAVGAVVEDDPPAAGPGVERIGPAIERLPVDVGPGWDPVGRPDQAADLRRHDVVVSRPVAQDGAQPALGGPVAVQGCDVEVADPERPCPLDGPRRLVVVDLAEQAADRRRPEAEPGHLDIRSVDPHGLERFVGHGGPRDRQPGSH